MATKPKMKLKADIAPSPDDLALIACALKSLAVYTAMACEHDDDPEDLQQIVDEGLEAIDRNFEY